MLKVKNYKKKVWDNKFLMINYDSLQSMWIMYNWIVDWEEFNLIKDSVKEDQICFDVGANMGFYSIWLSKFTNNKIYSFEPNKKNYDRLIENISINKGANIIANNCGLSDQSGSAKFTKSRDGENHIVLEKTDLSTETIQLQTIDEVIETNNIERIGYLKIDVEGFELNVLKGAKLCLKKKQVDIIQLEINNSIHNSHHSIQDLVTFLESYGYPLASYHPKQKLISLTNYTPSRENYFAVHDIDKLNSILN
ncbi:MAG: FkbM family methyltransferase [Bacteroidia bacterium]